MVLTRHDKIILTGSGTNKTEFYSPCFVLISNITCIQLLHGPDNDLAVGAESDELILQIVDQQNRRVHVDDFSKLVVQLAVSRVQPDLVRVVYDAVAAQHDVVSPPQQSAGNNKVLFLGLVPEELPLPREHRIVGDARSAGYYYVLPVLIDGGILKHLRNM